MPQSKITYLPKAPRGRDKEHRQSKKPTLKLKYNKSKATSSFFLSGSVAKLERPLRTTVLPINSDSDIMFCLQSCQGLIIER